MRIGLDVDGVMYQFHRTACYMLRTMKGYPDTLRVENWTSWNWIKDNVSKEDWRWLWSEGVELGLFRHGHLHQGTIEAVRELSLRGDVVIITQRRPNLMQDTLDWLSYHKFPINELHLLHEDEAKSSVPHCDYYVDDKPDNVIDLRDNTKAAMVFLWQRPWNKGFVWPGVRIVKTWEGMIGQIDRTYG